MFSIFISVGSCHKVPLVPTNLSEPLWSYDSQRNGETFNCIFMHTVFIKGRKVTRTLKGIFLFLFPIFFFQQNKKINLSFTSQSFFRWCISDIISRERILSHFIFQKQFTHVRQKRGLLSLLLTCLFLSLTWFRYQLTLKTSVG